MLTFGSRYESDPAGLCKCIAVDIRSFTVLHCFTSISLPIQHHNRLLRLNRTDRLLCQHIPDCEWVFHIKEHTHSGPTLVATHSLSLPGRRLGYDKNFAIHRGYLYAVSILPSTTVNVNESSFYYCQRVPLDDTQGGKAQSILIWWRSHAEGTINNSWTRFDLRVDESTGELLIVETRRERLGNNMKRTWVMYIQAIAFRKSNCPLTDIAAAAVCTGQVDPNRLLTLSNHSGEPVGKLRKTTNDTLRLRHVHSERLESDFDPLKWYCVFQEFRYQFYDPNCYTSLDVVEEIDGYLSQPPIRQIRFSIGSHVEGSPGGSGVRNGEGQLPDLKTTLWPPPKALKELHDIFKRDFDNQMGIICTTDHDTTTRSNIDCTGENRLIFLVNFDPSVRFQGLSSLKDPPLKTGATPPRPGDGKEPECAEGIVKVIAIANGRSEKRTFHAGDYRFEIWEERAMWMDIGRGFQLR